MSDIFVMDQTINSNITPIESLVPAKKVFPLQPSTSRAKLLNTTNITENKTILTDISPPIKPLYSSESITTQKKNNIFETSLPEHTIYENNTPKRKRSRKDLLSYRQELLKTEQNRVTEISLLRKSVDRNNELLQELVETSKEKNKILIKYLEDQKKSKID